MIYLDNSATTRVKPKKVIQAINKGLTIFSANAGRSGHTASINAGMEIFAVREKIRNFVNAPDIKNIVFTANCTDALNLAILGSVKNGGHVVCTVNEHNSVLRPLHHLKEECQITFSVAEPARKDILTASDIEKHIKDNTYLVCVNHISNVDGMLADIDGIGKLCRQKNILFLVDAAQSAGHIKLDMQKSNIDLLALAPHKGLYGPQGIGILAFSERAKLKPVRFGGTGTESFNPKQPTTSPECFESGTLAVHNILGVGAGIDFVNLYFEEIQTKIEDLTAFINFELRKIENVIVYTHPNNCHGVIAFNIKNKESESVAQELNDRFGICVRSGLQCAPLKHTFMKTINTGVVRVSLSYFNDFSDATKLIKAVKKIAKD